MPPEPPPVRVRPEPPTRLNDFWVVGILALVVGLCVGIGMVAGRPHDARTRDALRPSAPFLAASGSHDHRGIVQARQGDEQAEGQVQRQLAERRAAEEQESARRQQQEIKEEEAAVRRSAEAREQELRRGVEETIQRLLAEERRQREALLAISNLLLECCGVLYEGEVTNGIWQFRNDGSTNIIPAASAWREKYRWDVVSGLDGCDFRDASIRRMGQAVLDHIAGLKPGDRIQVTLYQNGEKIDFSVPAGWTPTMAKRDRDGMVKAVKERSGQETEVKK